MLDVLDDSEESVLGVLDDSEEMTQRRDLFKSLPRPLLLLLPPADAAGLDPADPDPDPGEADSFGGDPLLPGGGASFNGGGDSKTPLFSREGGDPALTPADGDDVAADGLASGGEVPLPSPNIAGGGPRKADGEDFPSPEI